MITTTNGDEYAGVGFAARQMHIVDRSLIDSFKETFDHFPLKSLIAVGETCDRLLQVAGYYFRKNYANSKIYCRNNHLFINHQKADHFARFIHKISIDSKIEFEYFVRVQSKFHHLKQIIFEYVEIDARDVENIKSVACNIESLRLEGRAIPPDAHFHEILNSFPNLKHLRVVQIPRESIVVGVDNKWLRFIYRSLQHLELVSYGAPVIEDIAAFLERNPNIKTFFTFARCFCANKASMLNADVELDELILYMNYDSWVDFVSMCDLLHKLYESKFYKRLHLQYICGTSNQEFFDEMASLSALVKLTINIRSHVQLSAFSNLEDLFIDNIDQIRDFDVMIFKLKKLKRIRVRCSSLEHIAMLMSRASELKQIVVESIMDKNHVSIINNIAINLTELNMEREKLENAQKVTFYVPEDIYLATIWAKKQTDLNLVRLRRMEKQDNSYNLVSHNSNSQLDS